MTGRKEEIVKKLGKFSRAVRRRAGWAAVASAAAAAVPAFADVSSNTSGSAQQNGVGNAAVTISLSGSTAMRSFTTSPGSRF